jgi:outer membrane receptor protein involved in Fe transport
LQFFAFESRINRVSRSMVTAKGIAAVAVLSLAVALGTSSAQTVDLEGAVRDSQQAVIPEALVTVHCGSSQATTTTDVSGHFAFPSVPGTSGTVEVSREGFTTAERSWNAGGPHLTLEFALEPSSTGEEVTVSAARTEVRLAETPGSTVLLSDRDMHATPALRVDDVLRQVPGFSLFRRSDSRVANASNQGVSLRGLGGSASSRALVLEDGLPIVDAFGGWVYWDRVARESISDVEVFRGGASNLYGSDALGGVVQFVCAFFRNVIWQRAHP